MSKNAKNDRITLNERDNKATKDQLKNVGEKSVFDEMKAYDDILRNKQLMELDKSNKKLLTFVQLDSEKFKTDTFEVRT